MKTLSAIVIGAGSRGTRYSEVAASDEFKDKLKIVGVAEPIEVRRNHLKQLCSIPEENCYTDWQGILNRPKFADIAIIGTTDRMHFDVAMAAIRQGYHLLLEKPIAPTPEECVRIADAADAHGVKVLVCHVLRYAPFFKKVKSIVDSGKIGRVQSIVHVEAVGNIHQSHSYVRGRWHNEKKSAFMLLAKSCHDIDLIHWLIGKECRYVQSFGSLTYFTRENAPEGAPERCIDGCPHGDKCVYNAVKLYYEDKNNNWFRSAATNTVMPTDEEVEHALRTTDYGRCVFRCDNDVVDHQVVNMEYEDGTTVSFSMNAFNKGGRYIRIFGTEGELFAYMSDKEITVYTFADRQTEKIPVLAPGETIVSGHGGGDRGIVEAMYHAIAGQSSEVIADIHESCETHLLVFAAEESRLQHTVVDVREYMRRYGFKN